MLGLALDPCNLATLMGIGIRQDNIFVQAYLGIQPAVAMRWILRVVLTFCLFGGLEGIVEALKNGIVIIVIVICIIAVLNSL